MLGFYAIGEYAIGEFPNAPPYIPGQEGEIFSATGRFLVFELEGGTEKFEGEGGIESFEGVVQ